MQGKYKAVVFDLDGTLLNTLDDLANAGNKTLNAMGLPTHPVDAYKKMVGRGIPNLVENMLPEQNRGLATTELALTLFQKNYSGHMYDATAPYPGILNMLEKLKENNIKTAILSNKAHHYVLEIADKYFPHYIDIAMGLSDEFPVKPDPASCLHILDTFGEAKAEVLYCGDSNVDMLTAKNAGLTACGVLWGFREKDELLAAGADTLVRTAEELTDLILL